MAFVLGDNSLLDESALWLHEDNFYVPAMVNLSTVS